MQHTLDNLIQVHLYIACVLHALTAARTTKGIVTLADQMFRVKPTSMKVDSEKNHP